MSNGLCKNTCLQQNFAVAILQQHLCWCSNTIPTDQSDMSKCSGTCPGTSNELCGGDGYFGYLV